MGHAVETGGERTGIRLCLYITPKQRPGVIHLAKLLHLIDINTFNDRLTRGLPGRKPGLARVLV